MFFFNIDPNDPEDIVQTWLSNNETKRDLITHLFDTQAEFIISLYDYHYPTKKFQRGRPIVSKTLDSKQFFQMIKEMTNLEFDLTEIPKK